MAGQFQKDVREVGQHGQEVGDPDPILKEALDHVGHEAVAPALGRELAVLTHHVLTLRNRSREFFGEAIRPAVPPMIFRYSRIATRSHNRSASSIRWVRWLSATAHRARRSAHRGILPPDRPRRILPSIPSPATPYRSGDRAFSAFSQRYQKTQENRWKSKSDSEFRIYKHGRSTRVLGICPRRWY